MSARLPAKQPAQPPMSVWTVPPRHRRHPVVGDANAFIADVLHHQATGRSILTDLARDHLISVCTPTHIRVKVEQRLPEVAERRGNDVEAALAVWREVHQPHVRFVDLAPSDLDYAQVRAVTDVEDRPVAALALLLAPATLLTQDKHLTEAGFGQHQWVDALNLIGDLLVVDGGLHAGATLTWLSFLLAGELAKSGIRLLGRSPVATGIAAGSLAFALFAREALGLRQRVRQDAGVAVERAVRGLADVFDRRQLAERAASKTLTGPPPQPPMHAHIARILAQHVDPLPRIKILRRLETRGMTIETTTLSKTLRWHPAFRFAPGRGWELGLLAGQREQRIAEAGRPNIPSSTRPC